MLVLGSVLLVLILAPGSPPSPSPSPGIAPGQLRPPASDVRFVAGHRLVQQADGSWSSLDRRRSFVAHISPDGQLRFDAIDTRARPPHPWYVQTRDPITGQPAGLSPAGVRGSNDTQGGAALGALITAGIFQGLELRSDRRHDKPGIDEPLDARDRFALDTADFRSQLATRWYDARLQESLDRLDADLRGLWSDAITPKTRRLAVYERWMRFEASLPEVPLHPPPAVRGALEQQRAAIGRAGREFVLEFVRAYLPRGTKEGYPRAELRRLNEVGGARQPFDPYATPSPPPPQSTRAR